MVVVWVVEPLVEIGPSSECTDPLDLGLAVSTQTPLQASCEAQVGGVLDCCADTHFSASCQVDQSARKHRVRRGLEAQRGGSALPSRAEGTAFRVPGGVRTGGSVYRQQELHEVGHHCSGPLVG